jgi:WXXGXW repeat (2 copies)
VRGRLWPEGCEYFASQQRLLFQPVLYRNMKTKLSTVGLASLLFVGLSLTPSIAQVGISIGIAPPPIPIYEQPYPPAEGYIWTPGYWAYDSGYYWVPGVWILPPRVGFLWTPGYWAYNGSNYFFNEGYWGPTVGFYGGINYGWGYGGQGYYGGRWFGNTFRYNTAVTRVNTTVIHNTYVNKQVVKNTGSRASFNGQGGTTAKPTAKEQAAAKAEHIPATSVQTSRVEAAKNDPALHVANNQGKPKAEAIKEFHRRNGEAQTGAGKATGKAGEAANGNSAFGHKQGDATTRTMGSQNNAHGKARSAEAHTSHTAKAATVRHAAYRPQTVSHRPPSAPVRQAGPAASTHPKGQTARPSKKKKPENQEPGGGH